MPERRRRPVELRAHAAVDIERAVDHYLGEAGAAVALQFIDAVEHAIVRMSGAPHAGSLLFSYELGIPDLRGWPLGRFPYVIFYVAGEDHVDVWRLLHSRRDLPAELVDEID